MGEFRAKCAASGLLIPDSQLGDDIRANSHTIFLPQSKLQRGWAAAEEYWNAKAATGKRSFYEPGAMCSVKPMWWGAAGHRFWQAEVIKADNEAQRYTLKIANGRHAGTIEKNVHSNFMDKDVSKGDEVERKEAAEREREAADRARRRAEAEAERKRERARKDAIKAATLDAFKAEHPGVEPKWWDYKSHGPPAWVTPQEFQRREDAWDAERARERAELDAMNARVAAQAAANNARVAAETQASVARRDALAAKSRAENDQMSRRAACMFHVGKPPSFFRASGGKCPRCGGQIYGR